MPNALAHEKSPYLQQHADNPVAWLPWGEVAFARAREEQKPIFLSIGYSTCHWCHVMAHESFEDPEVAELLNAHFVPIKVDREERPDVDKVYMSYVQAYTGHGGWPLSAWLTPELKPFFGGTYFPPEDRQARAGFRSLLRAIAKGWKDERDKLLREADRVLGALRDYQAHRHGAAATSETLAEHGGEAFEKGFQYFFEAFDEANGGFGNAPKFPRASNLNFLFRCAAVQGAESELGRQAVAFATTTLRKMATGGIHDHVGGGFHRYAVDEAWFVPHFEKMLYDQAQIAVNLLDAHLATGDERYAWVARGTLDYVLRDLAHAAGGFYAAEDADSLLTNSASAHGEGAFYVWTQDELTAALGEDAALVCAHFGVKPDGNVPLALDPQGEFRHRNILHARRPLGETAAACGLEPDVAVVKLALLLEQLRDVRAQRPRPHRDEKIITAWNGLMISALARAATAPAECLRDRRAAWLEAAVTAAEFVRRELHDEATGQLFRHYCGGRGTSAAFAEDYAYFIAGLLDLYEATWDDQWLQWADRLQAVMDERFLDADAGGYFNSAADDASIVLRLKEDYDGAEPAPGSVAAANLVRLAAITHDEVRRVRARCTVAAAQAMWSRAPQALPEMLCALERILEVPRQLVLAGEPASAEFQALAAVAREALGPRRTLLAVDFEGTTGGWLRSQAAWLAEMKPNDGRATAYLCEGFTCQAPVTLPEELRKQLNPGTGPAP
ncbi:MAG: hypothetical protein RIS54_793 [Verrucomicrobiota bacterium]